MSCHHCSFPQSIRPARYAIPDLLETLPFSCTSRHAHAIASPAAGRPTAIHYGKPFAVVNPIALSCPSWRKRRSHQGKYRPVNKVCNKGCWMSLKDGDYRFARFKDYAFMPTSWRGYDRRRGPQGIKLVTQVAHLEKEGAKVPASGEELKLVADGAEVRTPTANA